jgi:hypothetical protein
MLLDDRDMDPSELSFQLCAVVGENNGVRTCQDIPLEWRRPVHFENGSISQVSVAILVVACLLVRVDLGLRGSDGWVVGLGMFWMLFVVHARVQKSMINIHPILASFFFWLRSSWSRFSTYRSGVVDELKSMMSEGENQQASF